MTNAEDLEVVGPAANKSRIRLVFAGLMVAMLLASLDQTIFSTALPTIVGELNGVNQMLWVTTAYILASTIMMPIYGKLGDVIGRKGLFIGALSLFVIGSVVGGLAQNMTWLIVGRVVQGLGGGGLIILSQAIIADVVPPRERGRYLGAIGGVFGVAAVLGPLLGGWFTENIGWRWAFWMNIPLGLLAILAALVFLKIPGNSRKPRMDVAGIATMSVAVTALILMTSWGGNTYSWTSPVILILGAVFAIGAIAFIFIEQRAVEPIIPLHLFKDRNFNLATVAGLILALAMFGAISYLPTYLQMVAGVNATVAGYLLLPMIVGLLVASITTGQLASKTGRYKWMPIVSSIVTGVGLLLLSMLTVDAEIWVICSYVFVLGTGIGIGLQILVLIVQNSFPNSEVGTATASNNFFREIGASLGAAIVGSLFTAKLSTALSERLTGSEASWIDANSLTPSLVRKLPDALQNAIASAYADALTPVFLYLVPVALLSAALCLLIKEKPLATTTDDLEEAVLIGEK